MKAVWINKQDNSEQLILFFCGWGGDEKAFEHLQCSTSDVLFLSDYRNLELEENIIDSIREYPSIKIIAWSFGVWVAAYSVKKYELPIQEAIAINGTLFPVDDEKGIPEKIANATLEHLTEASVFKFQRRMVGAEYWKEYLPLVPNRDLKDIKSELSALYKYFKQNQVEDLFTTIIIGKRDMIFPYLNQKNAWKNKAGVLEIEACHYCFLNWDSWNALLNAKSEVCYG